MKVRRGLFRNCDGDRITALVVLAASITGMVAIVIAAMVQQAAWNRGVPRAGSTEPAAINIGDDGNVKLSPNGIWVPDGTLRIWTPDGRQTWPEPLPEPMPEGEELPTPSVPSLEETYPAPPSRPAARGEEVRRA